MGSFVFVMATIIVFLGTSLPTNGQTTRQITGAGCWRWHGHRWTARLTPKRGTDWHGRRQRSMRSIETCLDEILAFWLGDKRLELGSGKGVYEASLGDDEEQNLGASECRELVCL